MNVAYTTGVARSLSNLSFQPAEKYEASRDRPSGFSHPAPFLLKALFVESAAQGGPSVRPEAWHSVLFASDPLRDCILQPSTPSRWRQINCDRPVVANYAAIGICPNVALRRDGTMGTTLGGACGRTALADSRRAAREELHCVDAWR